MWHEKLFRIVFLLAVAALMPVTAVHALQVVTEENAPFNYTENGKLTGLSVEIVTALGERARVPMTLQSLPWEQAYAKAQSSKETCIFSTARLTNRENIFKWVGPLASNAWGLFAKMGFNGEIKKLADAKPWRIGAVSNDAKVEWLKERSVTNIVTAAEDRLIPPLLTLDPKQPGGVDLWVTGLYSQKAVAAGAKVTDTRLVLKLNEIELWLACNPGVERATISALGGALDTMKKDGSHKKIVDAYLKRYAPQ